MLKFEIYTDSASDLPKDMIEKFHLHVMQLEVMIDDNPPVLNNQVDIKTFYEQLSGGINAKTAAVTPGYFEEAMEKTLKEGKDLIYIGASSGISATYNNGVMIIKELQQKYPERKMKYIDTLCASAGEALLVYYAALLRESGSEIEEVYEKISGIKDRIHHQVTVDDLFFLKRGGRISATTAVAGSVLKIKPILNINEEGKIINVAKARGRKGALRDMFARLKESISVEELEYVFISHAACLEDAKKLAELIQDEYHQIKVSIFDIGPVIGAHTGPGGLALCYLGKTIKGTAV